MNNPKTILKILLRVFGHIFFWVVIYYFYAYFLGYGNTNTEYVKLFSGFLVPVTIFISYFLVYYLVPKYLLTKKYKLFILYSIYTLILSVYAIILSILYGLVYSEGLEENTAPLTRTLPFIVLGVFFVVLIVVSFSLIMHNYKSIVNNENLRNKILNTQLQMKEQELKYLKMQIHPHFLFNSLNTIYGFALKKKDEAPEMILKLSNLLDYILYQIEKPQVLLTDEVNHLKDYISLEKMRFHDTLNVELVEEIRNNSMEIAPMLLIPFVENAFKHGDIINGNLTVQIEIKTMNDTLNFQIENSSKNENTAKKGIGLDNIEKRLNMLYPNSYTLNITQKENSFMASLTVMNLKSIQNG